MLVLTKATKGKRGEDILFSGASRHHHGKLGMSHGQVKTSQKNQDQD
jgi:hypothetical protein